MPFLRRREMAAHLGRLLSPLGLFLLNAWLIRELFTLEYGVHMGSIEPTYISLARFLMEQWPDISWFRFWYGGVPLENTYPPLLNWVVAGWSILSHSSPRSPITKSSRSSTVRSRHPLSPCRAARQLPSRRSPGWRNL